MSIYKCVFVKSIEFKNGSTQYSHISMIRTINSKSKQINCTSRLISV